MKSDDALEALDLAAPPPARASVLLVDDSPASMIALKGLLDPLAVRLVEARSGDEALARVLEEDFAVILLDVRMPGMCGLETAALIKQRKRSRDIPIIFLSAFDREASLVARGYAQGAVDYLVKPYEPEILRSKVAVFVDLYLKGERIKWQEALLRRRERRILERASELRVRTLTDAMPLALWSTGPRAEIAYVNQRGSEYSDGPPEPGARWWELDRLHPDDRDRARVAWEEALRTRQPFELSHRMRTRRDGAYRWHLSRAVPEVDARGDVTGWIVTATDIDDQRRAEEVLGTLLAQEHEARHQAEAASRLKDEFLAIVSHELRTPLTAILGWARLLRAGGAAIDQGRALETIERNAAAQVRLIEDLLDVSRVINGKLHIEPRAIDARAIVIEAADAIRPAAEAKGIALDVDVSDAPVGCHADAGRLSQVCSNLLGNAVKFTPRGGRVTVRLTCTEDALAIEVIDTGQGISPSFLPHLFERFRQADTTSTRAHAGLGLGLALVRSLVELHGGTVRAESPGEGRGSVFTVTLPRRAPAPATTERSTDDAAGAITLDGVRVLVVDDEADARELIATVLTNQGAEVRVAASAADAFEALQQARPDVLLSDLGMPREDGYALIRRVRRLAPAQGGAIPAAALTAYTGPEVGQRARAAGFQTHVAKPVDPARLTALVAELARRPAAA